MAPTPPLRRSSKKAQLKPRPSKPNTDTDTIMTDPPETPSMPSQAPAGPSNPLFRLPRELRDKIYAHVLTSTSPILWPSPHQTHNLTPSLLRTSRAIYVETAPLLYSSNRFLFSHPSDVNMFRVTASAASEEITDIFLRIRDKDVKLWTAYLGSADAHRSLQADLPKLKRLAIFYRSGFLLPPLGLVQANGAWVGQHHPHAQNHGPQHANLTLHQQFQQHVQHIQAGIAAGNHQLHPPPPPPPPPPPHQERPVIHLETFFRYPYDPKLKELCMNLEGRTHAEIRVYVMYRVPREEVRLLVETFPEQLVLDGNGDARTRHRRELWGVGISVELSAVDAVGGGP
ncbi:hypothetical protein H2201_002750 [Coniosporium apollinis]|uniref:F-box domain-containing protein n=1 Tax=Coniosporium apollinis TaxID=61459 RepID=A0ABQ9NXX7_9PEZI|nr:hypothetical protein H2201_002750 [Coniosporium apollinis]